MHLLSEEEELGASDAQSTADIFQLAVLLFFISYELSSVCLLISS